ncbi:type IV pilus secretin PilQ [Moraxella oblonga]|uniref:type IV pilus secretin PilQ n=1 Tax=Moraxella oblonga TaxID=200413 RepID=UPI00082FAC49|nr:type IV pilus secretin PilQ [Moraxella oblonga]
MTFLSKKSTFVYSALAVSMLAVEAHALAIQSLSATQASDNSTHIRINFDGKPTKPVASQQAGNQMVFDFKQVSSSGLPRDMPINRGLVNSVTALNSGSDTRLLVNLNGTAKYTSSIEGNQLVLKIAQDNNTRAVQPASSQATNVRVNPLLNSNVGSASDHITGISSINYSGTKNGGGSVKIALVNEYIPVDVQRQGNKIVVRTKGTTIPRHLINKIQASGLVTSVTAANQGQSGVITIDMKGDFEYQAYQSGSTLNISIAPPTKLQDPTSEKKVYKGEPLSMEFQDVSVRTVLDVLSQFTNSNIIAADNVQGNITLRLINVPWDQALDIILQSKNLGMQQNGNVIWVAPAAELAANRAKILEDSRKIDELMPLRTEYIKLNYAKADTVIDLLKNANSSGGGSQGNGTSLLASPKGAITADARTNTIIVKDTSAGIDNIREMITQIDIPLDQVMIEARIVTATEAFSKEIGVRWGATHNSTTPAFNPLKPTATLDSAGLSVNLMSATSAATSSFNVGLLSISDMLLDLTLQAMQAERRGEVISSPKVLTEDNQTAKILSGKEIPYQEASASGATNTSFKEAALSLEATPKITPEGKISLKLTVENADTTGEVYGGVPVIRRDSVNTNVLLEDGQTVVLGGVFRNTISNGKSKVPFLGDIPGVGRLFKYDNKENNKEELLIFITPKLIHDNTSRMR